MILKNTSLLAVVGAALLSAAPVQASFATYFGQDMNAASPAQSTEYDFAAEAFAEFNVGGTYIYQNFEGSDAPTGAVPAGGLNLLVGGLNVTLKGTGAILDTSTAGRFSVSGNSGSSAQGRKYLGATASSTGSSFEVSFGSTAVRKFGFFGTDIGDLGGLLQLDLLDEVGSVKSTIGLPSTGALVGADARGSVLFFGFETTDPLSYFHGIRFRNSSAAVPDGFGFDMFTAIAAPTSTPMPAPGTLALLGTALVGLALMRRRA